MDTRLEPQKLNEVQLMLLKMFSKDIPPEALKQLKRLLIEFYDDVVQGEIERLKTVKDLDQTALDQLQQKHPKRTPY